MVLEELASLPRLPLVQMATLNSSFVKPIITINIATTINEKHTPATF